MLGSELPTIVGSGFLPAVVALGILAKVHQPISCKSLKDYQLGCSPSLPIIGYYCPAYWLFRRTLGQSMPADQFSKPSKFKVAPTYNDLVSAAKMNVTWGPQDPIEATVDQILR